MEVAAGGVSAYARSLAMVLGATSCAPRVAASLKLILVTLMMLAGLAGLATSVAQDGTTQTIEVRVWQDVGDELDIYISARPSGGSWRTLGTIPLPLDDGVSSTGRFRYGDIRLDVPLLDRPSPATVEIRVWQHQANSARVYVSARHAEGDWARLGTIRLRLDDGTSRNGRYRYGDILLDVPLPPPTTSMPAPVPEDSHPEIVFLGEVGTDRQAEITTLTLDVMANFSERFDTLVSDLTLYIGADEERWSLKMQEVSGATPPSWWCGLAEGNVVFLRLSCVREQTLAHEYFHVLQEIWAPEGLLPPSDTGWDRGAWWLMEGSAEYAGMEYLQSRPDWDPAQDDYGEGLHGRRWMLSYATLNSPQYSLRDFESHDIYAGGWYYHGFSYDLATLAMHALALESGEAASAEYFRLLTESRDWREAFQRAFGTSVEDFYEAFEQYHSKVVPRRWRITGRISIAGEERATRWPIDIYAFADPSPLDEFFRGSPVWSAPDDDGFFFLELPDGSFRIALSVRCRDRNVSLGWYAGDEGFVPTKSQSQPVVVKGSNSDGLHIRVPAAPSEVDEVCDFGPQRDVRGTVLGPDGEPLNRVRIVAWDNRHNSGQYYGRYVVETTSEGVFRLGLPDGAFRFAPQVLGEPVNSETVAWVNLPSDWYELEPVSITVDGEDVSGVRIKILDRNSVSDHIRLDRLGKTAGSSQ